MNNSTFVYTQSLPEVDSTRRSEIAVHALLAQHSPLLHPSDSLVPFKSDLSEESDGADEAQPGYLNAESTGSFKSSAEHVSPCKLWKAPAALIPSIPETNLSSK